MYKYAIINKDGIVIGVSILNGEVIQDDMILVDENFDTTGKKYQKGEWVEYVEEKVFPPTQQEIINAQILSKLEYLECLQELNSMKGGNL